MLKIPLDFYLDANHKQDKYSKIFLKKGLKFNSSKKDDIVTFYLDFLLLLAKINLFLEE